MEEESGPGFSEFLEERFSGLALVTAIVVIGALVVGIIIAIKGRVTDPSRPSGSKIALAWVYSVMSTIATYLFLNFLIFSGLYPLPKSNTLPNVEGLRSRSEIMSLVEEEKKASKKATQFIENDEIRDQLANFEDYDNSNYMLSPHLADAIPVYISVTVGCIVMAILSRSKKWYYLPKAYETPTLVAAVCSGFLTFVKLVLRQQKAKRNTLNVFNDDTYDMTRSTISRLETINNRYRRQSVPGTSGTKFGGSRRSSR